MTDPAPLDAQVNTSVDHVPDVSPTTALVSQVRDQWAKWLLARRRPPTPHPDIVWASGWRKCARRMAYDCVAPEQQLPYEPDTLARFQRGDDREHDLLLKLMDIGNEMTPRFKVQNQQQKAELRGRSGRVVMRGYIDGFLYREDDRHHGVPLEVKAWANVDRLDTFEDVVANPWTQGGSYQLLVYLVAHNVPGGILLLDRSGVPKLLPVELTDANWQRVETFLARAEMVLDHIAANTLPDFIDDPAECARCPYFGTACQPPLAAKDIQVLTDPEFEQLLERWWALREAGRDFNRLDDQVKKRLRGIEQGLAGAFAITGTWGKQSRLELPAELKQQYTVVDPKGRFTVEVERL